MRISDVAARMTLARLEQYGHDGTLPVEITLGEYRALLRDHVELCERVAELESRLSSSQPPPRSS